MRLFGMMERVEEECVEKLFTTTVPD